MQSCFETELCGQFLKITYDLLTIFSVDYM